jgi:hypothetical protein
MKWAAKKGTVGPKCFFEKWRGFSQSRADQKIKGQALSDMTLELLVHRSFKAMTRLYNKRTYTKATGIRLKTRREQRMVTTIFSSWLVRYQLLHLKAQKLEYKIRFKTISGHWATWKLKAAK